MNAHANVGAYLLGALDDAEMTAFEEHLAECDVCGRELDELSGVLPALQELREDGIGPIAAFPAAGSPVSRPPAAGQPPAVPPVVAPAAGFGHGTPGRHRAAAGGAGAGGGFAAAVADGSAFAGPPSGDGLLQRLLATVANERRGRRRRRLVAVAAAAVLAVGGPAIAVVATSDGGGHGVPVATAADWKASDRGTGVSADVAISDRAWGSAVDLRLSGVYGPKICHLEVIGRNGAKETAASWSVPREGYGTHVQPRPLTVHGASGLHRNAISRFDVRTSDGTLLVSVPDHSSPPGDEPRRQSGE